MIQVDSLNRRDVHIQFKRALLFVGARGEMISAIQERPPEGADPSTYRAAPILMDQLTGKARVEDGQLIVTYPNPGEEGTFIDLWVDMDNVAAVWSPKSVIAATPRDIAQTLK